MPAGGGTPRRVEDAQDPHHGATAVLDAVDLIRWKMEARARPDRCRPAAHVGDSLPLDDVADLVVGMAVHRGFARLNDPHELRHLQAAGILIDEISKCPLARSR